jgi:hypothetical protein
MNAKAECPAVTWSTDVLPLQVRLVLVETHTTQTTKQSCPKQQFFPLSRSSTAEVGANHIALPDPH